MESLNTPFSCEEEISCEEESQRLKDLEMRCLNVLDLIANKLNKGDVSYMKETLNVKHLKNFLPELKFVFSNICELQKLSQSESIFVQYVLCMLERVSLEEAAKKFVEADTFSGLYRFKHVLSLIIISLKHGGTFDLDRFGQLFVSLGVLNENKEYREKILLMRNNNGIDDSFLAFQKGLEESVTGKVLSNSARQTTELLSN